MAIIHLFALKSYYFSVDIHRHEPHRRRASLVESGCDPPMPTPPLSLPGLRREEAARRLLQKWSPLVKHTQGDAFRSGKERQQKESGHCESMRKIMSRKVSMINILKELPQKVADRESRNNRNYVAIKNTTKEGWLS